ncbi:MAG: helix-turn-helix domain-containing protein [Roseburia sp.]|nr:helix-turn-helix domain-containing protein [Roseburia sp.]
MKISQYLKIHKQMKILRIKADMSQKAMAGKLELSVPTYSNYENGYSEPPMEIIRKFCKVLGIGADDFFRYIIDNINNNGCPEDDSGSEALHRRSNDKFMKG